MGIGGLVINLAICLSRAGEGVRHVFSVRHKDLCRVKVTKDPNVSAIPLLFQPPIISGLGRRDHRSMSDSI